jgi:hypothetical protein
MTVPIRQPSHDVGAMLRALLDEGYRVTFTVDPVSAGCRADLTGPLGSQATGLGHTPAIALASLWLLDDDQADEPDTADDCAEATGERATIDATAAAVLAGKIIALREYLARAVAGEGLDDHSALEHALAELGRVSVILAAATEGDEDEDDAEPYCVTCGQWVGMFHGLDGWRHFRGDPAPGGRRDLHDAGHEAVPAWIAPYGRSLSPADMAVIRSALADTHAHAAQRHREETGAAGRAGAYAELLDRLANQSASWEESK